MDGFKKDCRKAWQACIIILATINIMGCQQHQTNMSKREVKLVQLEAVVEEVEGPPPGYKNEFASLEEWLTDMCRQEKPAKDVQEIRLDLMKSDDHYLVYARGVETSQERPDRTVEKTVFEPKHMYFILPDRPYAGTSFVEATDRLEPALAEFSKTDTFQDSFFTRAGKVTFRNKLIWSQP